MNLIIEKLKNKRKGFTIIEIIVVITLISIIGVGSIVGINYASNKNEDKRIEKAYKKFDDALEVYLSNHPEIYTNLEKNVQGAVITLEVLKNEGLVDEGALDQNKQKIDYKNSYYVLSDAVLLENQKAQEGTEENICDNQVEIEVIKSWGKLSEKIEKDDVLYICPKTDTTKESEDNNSVLEERIKALEYSLSLLNLGSNNYVKFDVSPNTESSISWADTDLWRIVNTNNGIKLMYDKPIVNNISKNKITDYKNDVLSIFSPTYSGERLLETDDGYYYLYFDSKPKDIWEISTAPNGGECRTPEKQECLVYDNNIYCKADSYVTLRKDIDYINKSGDKYQSGSTYPYIYEGEINNWIINNCYATPDYIEKMVPNIKYFTTNRLPYYDSEDRYHTAYRINTVMGINYDSIFGYKTTEKNSIKNILFENINPNIRDSISPNSSYKYSYTAFVDTGDLKINTAQTYNDIFGTLDITETQKFIEKDSSVLLGKNFMIGATSYGENGAFSATTRIVEFNSSYPVAYNEYAVETYDRGSGRLVKLGVSNYIPVMTLKNEYTLIINKDEYPESYKSACGDKTLGTKECPYLIKIGNYYSDGTLVS